MKYIKRDLRMQIADEIVRARCSAGLTQEGLAVRLNTQQPSIARAESGKVLPSIEFLYNIADVTGTEFSFGFLINKKEKWTKKNKKKKGDLSF